MGTMSSTLIKQTDHFSPKIFLLTNGISKDEKKEEGQPKKSIQESKEGAPELEQVGDHIEVRVFPILCPKKKELLLPQEVDILAVLQEVLALTPGVDILIILQEAANLGQAQEVDILGVLRELVQEVDILELAQEGWKKLNSSKLWMMMTNFWEKNMARSSRTPKKSRKGN